MLFFLTCREAIILPTLAVAPLHGPRPGLEFVRLTCEQPAEECPTFLRASLRATAEERRRERAPRVSPTFASRQLKRVQVSMQMKPPNIGTYHNTFNDWLSTGEDEQAVVLEMHQKGPPQKKSAR